MCGNLPEMKDSPKDITDKTRISSQFRIIVILGRLLLRNLVVQCIYAIIFQEVIQ